MKTKIFKSRDEAVDEALNTNRPFGAKLAESPAGYWLVMVPEDWTWCPLCGSRHPKGEGSEGYSCFSTASPVG